MAGGVPARTSTPTPGLKSKPASPDSATDEISGATIERLALMGGTLKRIYHWSPDTGA